MDLEQRVYDQGFNYELFKCQLEHHIGNRPQPPPESDVIKSVNKTYKFHKNIAQDSEAECLYDSYISTITDSELAQYQTPIALLSPDRYFWYNGDKLHCLGANIQLERNRRSDTFEFIYNDRILERLGNCYGIDISSIKYVFDTIGYFQSKTRYTAYHNALQRLKWLTGAIYLPLCDFPYNNFFLYKDDLFCYVNQAWRVFTADILNEYLQRGTKVCFDQAAKVAWLNELIKLPHLRRFSPRVFSRKIILNFDHQDCTLVGYSKDLDRFEYVYPNIKDSPPFGRERRITQTGRLPDMPIHPSDLLCRALFDMCGGRTSTLDSIAELFARAAIEDEPSKYIWVLGGDSYYLFRFLEFAHKIIMGSCINGVQYDSLFHKESLTTLLRCDLYGKWGLYEHRNSFSLGRKRSKWLALINGETIGSIEDELCGEIKVSSQMLAIIGTNNIEEITSSFSGVPYKIIELKKHSFPDIVSNPNDFLWLRTLFVFHGMRLIYGNSAEQKSSIGAPLKIFVEKFCSNGSDCWCDGKSFYDKYSRWLKATYPDLTISGSTTFLSSAADILGVKYETLRKNNNRKTLIGVSLDEGKCESEIFDTTLGAFSFEDFCSYMNVFGKYLPIDPLNPSPHTTIRFV